MKTLCLLIALLVTGCAGRVTVNHEHHFMTPDTWDIEGNGIVVGLYNGTCCCVAGRVADTVAARANRGALTWSRMADKKYSDSVLSATCRELGGTWRNR